MRGGIRDGVRRLFRLPLRTERHARADADEELTSFIDARVADLVARGHSAAEAHVVALERLGGAGIDDVRGRLRQSATHRERRMRLNDWLESVAQDLRFGARQLARTPGITVIAVLTLGIGVGANSAIFSVVDTVLLRPLPVKDPASLVAIGKTTAIDGHTSGAQRGDLLALPMYRDLQRDNKLVTGLAASGTAGRIDVRLAAGDDQAEEHPNGRFVSGSYFDVLGVPAERGRMFGRDEDGPAGTSPVAVISDSYWRRRFGGETDILGRTLIIDGAKVTIVGIAKRGFDGDVVERPTEIWLPISMQPIIQPHTAPIDDRATSWLLLLGRLAPGVTLARAEAGFTTLIRASLIAHAGSAGEVARARQAPIVVSSGAQGFSAARKTFRAALFTLQIGVALLLLIVCSNLANLLVGRALARRREMSVRLALGAGRGRLVRQLMTESMAIALMGTIAGVLFAHWGSAALVRAATTSDSPAAIGGSINGAVLAFALAVSTLTLLAFGLAPALRASRVDIATSLRANGRSMTGAGRIGRVPIGALLVPAQVVLCLVLLTGAALLAKSLVGLESTSVGMDRDHLVLAQLDVSRRGMTGEQFIAFAQELTTRLSALPGVRAASYSQDGLFTSRWGDAIVAVPGFTGKTEEDSSITYDLVGPGYLHAIGGRLLRGRDITDADRAKTPSVAVVNESAARFYFGTTDALGRIIYFDANVPTTVVGVVADIRDRSLGGTIDRRAYVPYSQQVDSTKNPFLALEIRVAGDPASLIADIRHTLASVDRAMPVIDIAPLSLVMQRTIRQQRLVATLAAAFGIAALLLAVVGLYGVMSYAVTRRTAEIGLRGALGADRAAVVRLILRDGMRLTALGLLAGIPLALLAVRGVRAQLDVPPADLISLAVAVLAIAVCGIGATLIPALRAARVPPAVALSREA